MPVVPQGPPVALISWSAASWQSTCVVVAPARASATLVRFPLNPALTTEPATAVQEGSAAPNP